MKLSCTHITETSAINPKGLVPAVEFNGKALYESLVICEFLEDAYPSHTPRLLPSDPYERARARIWIDHITKFFLPPFFRLLQSQEKAKQDEARQDVYKALSMLAKQRKEGGPFFFGEEFSLVDIAIAPWAERDYIITEHRGYKREEVGNGWKEWADALEKRESVKKTTSVSVSQSLYSPALLIDAPAEQGILYRNLRALPPR